MKYGKQFQQILESGNFPPEWKSSAIEYRQLKKLIKDVVQELSSMGLSPQILSKLMVTTESSSSLTTQADTTPHNVGTSEEDEERHGELLEFEFESDDSPILSSTRTAQVPKDVLLNLYDTAHEQEIESRGKSVEIPRHRFRLRLLSASAAENEERPIRPMGVTDMIRRHSEGGSTLGESSDGEKEGEMRGRRLKRTVVDAQKGVKAEYVLVGEASRPVPQLRFHLSPTSIATPLPDLLPEPVPMVSQEDPVLEDEDDDEEEEEGLPEVGQRPELRETDILPPSPTLGRVRHAASPIWALASSKRQDPIPISLGEPAGSDPYIIPSDHHSTSDLIAPGEVANHQLNSPLSHPGTSTSGLEGIGKERNIIIPLASDMAFFNLLTAALLSLSAFHTEQQHLFRESVEKLCRLISQSISPGEPPEVLSTPLTPSDIPQPFSGNRNTTLIHAPKKKDKSGKKDLYVWREIFSLWIEHEIFESHAERTRGERSVEQAEERLQRFAREVVKRGLGDRRTIRGRKTRESWEEFLRLNVLLLDLKRFQLANLDAARKILKKHDKRTALSASHNFASFALTTLKAPSDPWSFYHTSLPHVLLTSLTDVLLPILPSLDDYACLICTSIAFKPIRLACGHLFCVRCLVKMQKAGKGECPLCRAHVVLLADKTSLDTTLMNFMKSWFPKEVRVKQKENEAEVAKEQAMEAGIDPKCIIM
ncbi:hypothetical protein TREMEDRAFT_63547 [Tremella mesenterica DSM 1558]|uniref:uncharacterized protein n=1 Tax=Tremella mesenterica (strain ATCC 24925 / CBS 8224 / DSM 1558 / NBRC 9311 / NRRL Y-6157 / RJB 2259-6 / UBC 559-6) TaxID=578456 RepID=UPI0003F494B8|nr:uncharacterized protein TREMEDRAFT_63547 [Tremella mesenterica DSM 1558]EIW68379.1 hypothetical protein TREMEDRAFT_63547 [Tremella mesenterica DSM 1558]